MKHRLRYIVNEKPVEKEINYIPVCFILAIMLIVLKVLAVIGILVTLCYYVPYFYILAWLTEDGCVIKIIASDYNPDCKVPWLLIVRIVPIAGFILNYRSLVHHFENGVWMYQCEAVKTLEADMLDKLERCIEVTPEMLKVNLLQRFICAVVKIFAPML